MEYAWMLESCTDTEQFAHNFILFQIDVLKTTTQHKNSNSYCRVFSLDIRQ